MEKTSRLQQMKRSKKKRQKKTNFMKKTQTSNPHHIREEDQFIEEGQEHRNIQSQDEYDDEYEDIYEEENYIENSGEQEQSIKNIVPFMGTRNDLPEGQILEFSNSGYVMYHRATTEWPCLSVDFLLPQIKTLQNINNVQVIENFEYPLELYAVAGSQAEFSSQNQLYIMRFADLAQTKYDDDEDDGEMKIDEEEDENKLVKEDLEPVLLSERFQVFAPINRVRSMMNSPIVSLMNQTGQLQIFDISKNIESLESKIPWKSEKVATSNSTKMLSNFQLSDEGFGLNWSSMELGLLGSGTNDGVLNFFKPADENFSSFIKSDIMLNAHSKSIEDIQFSPVQPNVVATCSSDNTIRIFDLKDPSSAVSSSMCINSHQSDVNVISWNPCNPTLLASGDDDGIFKVFDLRFPNKAPITEITFHEDAICSIDWQPHDEWTLSVGSLDNRVSIWDLSVESDESGVSGLQMNKNEDELPEQLIYLHQGQEELREVRWHPVYKGVMMSTALDSFNVFHPCLDDFEDIEDEDDQIKTTDSPNDLIF